MRSKWASRQSCSELREIFARLGAPICIITMRSSRFRISSTRLHALLTERTEAPDIRPADADRGGAERQRLEDVGAAPKAAVDEHGHAAAHRVDDLGQRVDRAAQRLVGAAAVIADNDAVGAVLEQCAASSRVTTPLISTFIVVACLQLVDVAPT